ncbi:hypothetical protein [Sinomonas mesophila]|uniref:hypothetical protein n=1 Tax=Sinomonas mesophila TaxID=1531955 RepID=UPI0011157626|nr:hypothetical protein [Sinomonas mesophila]
MSEQAEVQAQRGNWGARIVVVLVLAVTAVLTYLVLAADLPRWWAETVRSQIGGQSGAGIPLGMFYGFVFTLVPLLVAWQATHRRTAWPIRLAIVLVAVALALPNLLTLAIVTGTSEGAHTAQRILGTDAPWFTVWSGAAAIAGAVVFLVLLLAWTLWRRRGRRIKELKQRTELARLAAEQSERDHAEELKEAQRQNVIARRIDADEEERRHDAGSDQAAEAPPEPPAEERPPGRHRRDEGAPEGDTRS